jgi:hypothetical protein
MASSRERAPPCAPKTLTSIEVTPSGTTKVLSSPVSNVCDTVAPKTAFSTRVVLLELQEVANNANAPTTTAARDTLDLRAELG